MMYGMMPINLPPGTRDYVACSLCRRPVNMERYAAGY